MSTTDAFPNRTRMLREAAASPALCWHRRAVAGGLGAFLLAAAWSWAGLPQPVKWNWSPSVPTGFYVWVPWAPVAKGAIVEVSRPPHYPLGWLLKRVVGTGGDSFCWDQDLGTHRLNGRPMPPPLPYAVEIMHVPVWKGCEVLAPDEIVGCGDTEGSFDNRYYQPLPRGRIGGVYRLVLAW